jgi:hypothetical protein
MEEDPAWASTETTVERRQSAQLDLWRLMREMGKRLAMDDIAFIYDARLRDLAAGDRAGQEILDMGRKDHEMSIRKKGIGVGGVL